MDSKSDAVPAADGHQAPAGASAHEKSSFWALVLGSVGVVYGDIGTSPLYAFREAVTAAHAGAPLTREIVLGMLSMILWSLIIVVTLKYVVLLLRMDNNGEGGTLSLTALAFRAVGRRAPVVLMLGIIGAAMFYGSSLITPALSVLSAVEGLTLITPAFERYVLPITLVLLVGPVRRPVPRHRQGCGAVRADHASLVLRHGAVRRPAHCRRPGRALRDQSLLRRHVSRQQRLDRADHARRGLPGRHRQRSALCRSRAFRAQADPDRMVLSRVSGAC